MRNRLPDIKISCNQVFYFIQQSNMDGICAGAACTIDFALADEETSKKSGYAYVKALLYLKCLTESPLKSGNSDSPR